MTAPPRRGRIDRARRAWRAVTAGDVDLTTRVGSVELSNPVMTASGTSGHADELQAYFPLAELGAVVVKSLSAEPWPGNPAPRVHPTPAGMLNSVGLQGPGVKAWVDDDLPRLTAAGARVVASIWGQRVDDFARAATMVAGAPGVVALEVNVSCPNIEDRRRMFAHSPTATAEVLAAVGEHCPGLPRWAKLSPTVADIAEVAGAAIAAGAEGLTLVNTVLAMAIDVEQRRPVLGSGPSGGGLSGPALHPLAVRAVFDVREAHPGAGIVGVGGVTTAEDAVELVLAGADAVQVGTATFLDPRAPLKVLRGLERWCSRRGVRRLSELVGAALGETGVAGFADRVMAAVARRGPLCVGIDPSRSLLAEWGLPDDGDGLRQFGLRCVDALDGVVAVVKPQVAFFERHGSAGVAALESVMAAARSAGLVLIADAKRSDIGTTMEAYASAWLGPDSTLAADAVTAVPYLGVGALQPLIDLAATGRRGVLVVVRSSNPEGRPLQQARTDSGRGASVEDMLLGEIAARNRGSDVPPGTVGAVVGATLRPSSFPLSDLGGVILAPGVGAQGAGASEVAALFAGCPRHSVLASASRSILAAGPDAAGLSAAAARTQEAMADALG